MKIISYPFGWVMYFCYQLFNNYGFALILFTLITKIVLLPFSIKQQKNSARMVALNPKLEKLKKKYGNNKEKYNEEMMKLYAEENVNPASSCLPLLIQMPIIAGLFGVIYAPLTYILRLPSDIIEKAKDIITNNADKIDAFSQIVKNKNFNNRSELYILDAIHKYPDKFSTLGSNIVDKIGKFDYTLFGLDLGKIPTIGLNLLVLIPIISFITNLGYTFYTQYMSRKNNPNMAQMGMGVSAALYIMPIFSAVLTLTVPAGVGVYWIMSTVFAFLQSIILYRIYSPERVAAMDAKKAPKKKKKSNMFQRALEAQQLQQNGGSSVSPSMYDDDEKLSKSALKELQRQRLNEARKRMAEKYGDTYDESAD